MTQKSENKLYEIALAQQGYFSAKQAVSAGYQINNHPYYVRQGRWIREHRGLYRLTRFPSEPEAQYALWSLWSCDRKGQIQGVYSFETALSIYDVSDAMPSKLHMTVPKKFRRSSDTPNSLELHKEDLAESDYKNMRGFRVTTPLRTLLDIISSHETGDGVIQQATDEFLKRGLLLRQEVLSLIEKEPRAARFFIEKKSPIQKS